jgi:hypothetical protein
VIPDPLAVAPAHLQVRQVMLDVLAGRFRGVTFFFHS